MNKIVSIIVTLGLVVGLGIIFIGDPKANNSNATESTQSVEVKNGVQYVTVLASGGYFPKKATARAGLPTKLVMKTNGTYDCSASLVINSIGFKKILPQNGETEIDIGLPKAGEPLQGICGMGMYNFTVEFI